MAHPISRTELRLGARSECAVLMDGERAGRLEGIEWFLDGANPGQAYRGEVLGQKGPLGTLPSLVAGSPCDGFGGALIHAIQGPITPLTVEGRTVGMTWDDGLARWCQLSGVLPRSSAGSWESQTADSLAALEHLLSLTGFAFHDVVRTWFVIDDIFAGYEEFNRARNRYFDAQGIRRIPASTAVGGPNPFGSRVIASALAVCPHDSRLSIRPAVSPLQRSPVDYGSRFSRGMELAWPTGKRLFVSGTASIAEDGPTLHVGDAAGQIDWTLDVVEALLQHHGLNFANVLSGIAYFRRPEDLSLLPRLIARGLRAPILCSRQEICREDLLFELELEAGSESADAPSVR